MSLRWLWPFGRTTQPTDPVELRRQLDDLTERLRALRRPTTRLTFRLLEEDDVVTPTMSHAGGVPYAEAGEVWPTCGTCGEALEHIVQVDLRHCVGRPTDAYDLVCLFDCLTCFPWGIDRAKEAGQWLVRTYRAPDDDRAVALEPPERGVADTCAIDFEPFDMVPLWDELNAHDRELAQEIEAVEDRWEEVLEALPEHVPERQSATTAGGYPLWIQGDDAPFADVPDGGDEAPGGAKRRMELLLQLDSEPVPGWMWGDSGMLYLFFDPQDPSDVRLALQCY